MPRYRTRPQRSVGEWGVRVVFASIVAVLGYFGVVQSFAYGLRSTDPARAHALAPWDGRLSAALAQTLSGPDATPATRGKADELARAALRRDSTAPGAASTLGINAQIGGDDRGARRLIAYAQKISRRDVAAQIWLIENAVSREDIAGALKHYDIALRTSTKSADLLFPVLAAAISDPVIRPLLTRTLSTRPPWSALFVEYAAANGPDPRATALLLRDLGTIGHPVSGISRTLLTDTLVSRGLIGDAWNFYASFRRGASRRSSRDPGFTEDLAAPTLFDWRAITDGATSASIQRGMLDFAAPPSVGGALVEQTQFLPPGRYLIAGHSIGIDQPPSSFPYWTLTCRGDREIGRVDVPNSALANGNFAGRVTVPSGCPVQTLSLTARPSDSASGVIGQIDRIRLSPQR